MTAPPHRPASRCSSSRSSCHAKLLAKKLKSETFYLTGSACPMLILHWPVSSVSSSRYFNGAFTWRDPPPTTHLFIAFPLNPGVPSTPLSPSSRSPSDPSPRALPPSPSSCNLGAAAAAAGSSARELAPSGSGEPPGSSSIFLLFILWMQSF